LGLNQFAPENPARRLHIPGATGPLPTVCAEILIAADHHTGRVAALLFRRRYAFSASAFFPYFSIKTTGIKRTHFADMPCTRRRNGINLILSRYSSRVEATPESIRFSMTAPMSVSCDTMIRPGLDCVAVKPAKWAGIVFRSGGIKNRFLRAAMAQHFSVRQTQQATLVRSVKTDAGLPASKAKDNLFVEVGIRQKASFPVRGPGIERRAASNCA
jgi:hypothetical protein